MMRRRAWVGIDVGKTSHHACAIDETGKVVWNQKVSNEQRAIEQLVTRACKGAEQVIMLANILRRVDQDF